MPYYRMLCPVLILRRIGLRTIYTKTAIIYADAQNVRNIFTDIKDDHFAKSVVLKLGITVAIWCRVGLVALTYQATTNDNRMQKLTITDTAHMHYIACYRFGFYY
jgi:hypothetical protein